MVPWVGWRQGAAMTTSDASDTALWLERAAGGDAEGWRRLLARHHDRLRRMVARAHV